jgi:hypothetical protein
MDLSMGTFGFGKDQENFWILERVALLEKVFIHLLKEPKAHDKNICLGEEA